MFFLIIIIALLSAFFATVTEYNNLKALTVIELIKKRSLLIIVSLPVFIMVFYFQSHYFLLLALGLTFLLLSFIYLGIIDFKRFTEWHSLGMHAFFIAVVTAISGLSLSNAVLSFVSFFVFLLIFLSIATRIKSYGTENTNELLELFQVINGIFFFVLGLVIAADRIRFLQKIAKWLF